MIIPCRTSPRSDGDRNPPSFSHYRSARMDVLVDLEVIAMRKNEKQQAVDALQALLRKHGLQVADIESPEQASRIGWRIMTLLKAAEVTQ
jgi:hypothetical protein